MAGGQISAAMVERIRPVWPDALERVAAGALLGDVAKALGFSRWDLQRYARQVPNARAELDAAMEDGADAMVEGLRETIHNSDDPRRARVMVDYTMRLATARNPGRYSERKQVDMRMQSLDMTAVLIAAQQRLAARQAPRELDVTPQPERIAAPAAALAELL